SGAKTKKRGPVSLRLRNVQDLLKETKDKTDELKEEGKEEDEKEEEEEDQKIPYSFDESGHWQPLAKACLADMHQIQMEQEIRKERDTPFDPVAFLRSKGKSGDRRYVSVASTSVHTSVHVSDHVSDPATGSSSSSSSISIPSLAKDALN